MQARYTPKVVPFAGILYSFCPAHMERLRFACGKGVHEVASSVELLLLHLREHLIGLRLCGNGGDFGTVGDFQTVGDFRTQPQLAFAL